MQPKLLTVGAATVVYTQHFHRSPRDFEQHPPVSDAEAHEPTLPLKPFDVPLLCVCHALQRPEDSISDHRVK